MFVTYVFDCEWCPESNLGLTLIGVTGTCGNLRIEHEDLKCGAKGLGSIEQLREAMTTSGNHKLDLKVTLTVEVPRDGSDDRWIIPR